jgi:hypothetical protein
VITQEFPITAGGALNFVAKITTSSVTVVGSITAKLQTAIGSDWVDAKTATISASGSVYIKLNVEVAADQTHLPLLNRGRIVVTTTDAGDELTVEDVRVLQEL